MRHKGITGSQNLILLLGFIPNIILSCFIKITKMPYRLGKYFAMNPTQIYIIISLKHF